MKAKYKRHKVIKSDPTRLCEDVYSVFGLINHLDKKEGWERSEAEKLLEELLKEELVFSKIISGDRKRGN